MPSNVATKPMNQSLQTRIDSDDDFRPGCQSVSHRINGHQSESFFFLRVEWVGELIGKLMLKPGGAD